MLSYSSQVRHVSCLWLQGSIDITTVCFSIANNELRGQFASFELSCNVETSSIGPLPCEAEVVIW